MNLIEEYLHKNYEKNRTIRQNRSHLNDFFTKFIKIPPEQYLKAKRDYDKDFEDYAAYIKTQSPCTRSNKLNTLKNFLSYHKITIDKWVLKRVTGRVKRQVQTLDVVPTKTQLKEILSHGNAKDRALFLFLSSSGLRIKEALSLQKNDISAFKQLKQQKKITEPITVYVPAKITKTQAPRITFISIEAWEALLEWEKEKPKYLLFTKNKYFRKEKPKDESFLFPYAYTNARNAWVRLLRKSGYDDRDKTTNIHQMHLHTLRAFFKNRLMAAGIQERYIETMLGHVGYVQGSYDKYSEETLAQAYSQGVKELQIFGQAQDLTEVNESLKQKDEQIRSMQQTIEEMKREMLEIKIEKNSNNIEELIRKAIKEK